MQLYTAFDLHSNNSYLGIIDENGKRVFKKKLTNDPESILDTLKPYKEDIAGIAVESTYNWYWLVDLLMAEGYKVHLANPAEIQKYTGLKYADDQHDAFWLTEMLRLGILPEGYIYPKEDRAVRDLLRKRAQLVRCRTLQLLSMESWVNRQTGRGVSAAKVRQLSDEEFQAMAGGNPNGLLSMQSDRAVLVCLDELIERLEQ